MQRFLDLVIKNIHSLQFEKKEIEEFIKYLDQAGSIFVVGMGKSGFVGKAFAMRLMHVGYRVYVIGETITPRIERGDLLVAISGSGETGYVVALAKKVKELGAKVLAVTSSRTSTLARISDLVMELRTVKDPSIAPMGTIFELMATIFFDSIIAEIMERKKLKEEDLAKRHSIENEVVV